MLKMASAVVADPNIPNPGYNASSAAAPEGAVLGAAEEARSQEGRKSAAL